jgi:glycosyltransferase involved in cell wall biosynthesis
MRILFLSRWFPYPPDNGSKIRIFNLVKQLAKSHDIALVSFADSLSQVDDTALRVLGEYCSSVNVLPYREFRPGTARAIAGLFSPSPRSLVDTQQADAMAAVQDKFAYFAPQLVIASQLAMVPYALRLRGVPLLLEELELSTFLDATRPPAGPIRRIRSTLTWLKLAQYLRRVLPRFAACTVVSERELSNVRSVVSDYREVRIISNGVDVPHYSGDFGPAQPNSVVFSGALTYQANHDAARYFLSDIYPSILDTVPDVWLRITGHTPHGAAAQLPRQPGVEYTGYVADIRPVVGRTWASVVPLRLGGGTRLKILESMALGTPVVATSKGAEGLMTTAGKDILIADEPAEFARCVVGLLRSPEMRARLAEAGRRLVETTYDWVSIGGQLDAMVLDVARSAA